MNWITPELLQTYWFRLLGGFVAANTLIYATLAFISILPKAHPSRWIRRNNTRSETRSIYPEDR